MKCYVIAAVLGCALILSANCNIVADTEDRPIQLEAGPENVNQPAAIVAEPLSVASSPQVEKILAKIPELIDEATDDQVKSAEPIEIVNSSPDVVVLPQNVSVQNSREPKQLIGFIPTYMLRQAMRLAHSEQDEPIYEPSDEIEEERAIRRRKRFRRRNTRGHVKKSRRHKNTQKRKQKKRRKVNSKRKSQNRHSPQRKINAPRTKNRRTNTKKKAKGSY